MRDAQRIDPTLNALRSIWQQHPDLRLGQLLMIAAQLNESCPALFYLEDDALLRGLQTHPALALNSTLAPTL